MTLIFFLYFNFLFIVIRYFFEKCKLFCLRVRDCMSELLAQRKLNSKNQELLFHLRVFDYYSSLWWDKRSVEIPKLPNSKLEWIVLVLCQYPHKPYLHSVHPAPQYSARQPLVVESIAAILVLVAYLVSGISRSIFPYYQNTVSCSKCIFDTPRCCSPSWLYNIVIKIPPFTKLTKHVHTKFVKND